MRNHYYGPGEGSTPADQAWYTNGGRLYEIEIGLNPLRVDEYRGPAENRPFFSFFQTDNLHAHQFPGLGSLLWKTPEFAMLQTSFWDQDRLYGNVWLGGPYSGGSWCTRDGAWMFMHMALAWKVASSTSDRLYSREDVLAFAQTDMEYFHDHFYASTPGFANPSSTMGDNYYNKLFYVADRFGCAFNDADTNFNGFHALYHLAALAYANRMGFIDALRATSTKCATVIDWIISRYRKSVVGLLTETTSPFVFGTNYSTAIWSSAMFDAAGGDLTTLPQNWAEVTAAFPPGGPDWHHSYGYGDGMDNPPTSTDPRNDDAQDFLLAGPSLLKYGLGLTGSDLDEAEAIAHGYREERRTEEQARGAGAGDVWFTYSKLSFQPLLPLE
jgi:hypothetical protein